MQAFIQKYGIDLWLLDQGAFTPEYLANNTWLKQYQPATAQAIARLQQGETPVLSKLIERCSVFNQDFVVLLGKCITK